MEKSLSVQIVSFVDYLAAWLEQNFASTNNTVATFVT
jgi:hypothetical protein